MKSNRLVGQAKSPGRVPPGSLRTADRSSAVEAFERWQRESPKTGSLLAADESARKPAPTGEALKN